MESSAVGTQDVAKARWLSYNLMKNFNVFKTAKNAHMA
jgi:hypothetical protein